MVKMVKFALCVFYHTIKKTFWEQMGTISMWMVIKYYWKILWIFFNVLMELCLPDKDVFII